jgi:Raf kinase inhibitor-like YbhB/YbcL family protein
MKNNILVNFLILFFVIFCDFTVFAVENTLELDKKLLLTSSAFKNGGRIPKKYTCDDIDISPPLTISGVSAKAKSLVIIMDDLDAPSGIFVHWLITNIDPKTTNLNEGVAKDKFVLNGAIHGRNDFGRIGYNGPCPPNGVHTYRIILYSLNKKLNLKPGFTRKELESAMGNSVLQQAILTATYSR